MKFRTFFFLIIIALSSNSYAQWWVDGGNLIWPNGDVRVTSGTSEAKRILGFGDNYYEAKSMFNDQSPVVALFYKTSQDWRPTLRNEIVIDDTNFVGTTHILAQYNRALLDITTGTQNAGLVGLDNVVWASLDSIAKWGTYGSMVGNNSNIYFSGTVGSVPEAMGFKSFFSSETGATDTVVHGMGFHSTFNRWGSGATHVDTFYHFYSRLGDGVALPSNVTFDQVYHFYGVGDYPSYFGGDIQTVGDLRIKDTDDFFFFNSDDGKFFKYDYNAHSVKTGDVAGVYNGVYMEVNDYDQRIDLNALYILMQSIPSDSTSVSTGELWFNSSTGAIHRKF